MLNGSYESVIKRSALWFFYVSSLSALLIALFAKKHSKNKKREEPSRFYNNSTRNTVAKPLFSV